MSDQGEHAGSPASQLGSSREGSSDYPTDPLPKVTEEEVSLEEMSSADPQPSHTYEEDQEFDVFTPYSERKQHQAPSPTDQQPEPFAQTPPEPEPEPAERPWSESAERPWSVSPLETHEETPVAGPESGDEWVFGQPGGHEPPIEMPPPPPADRKPGKPTSGNMKMPDWMREENNPDPTGSEEGRRSRTPLIVGIGILVVVLLVAAGVFLFRHHSNGANAAVTHPPAQAPAQVSTPSAPAASPPPQQKPLEQFAGSHSPVAGRVTDTSAGLSYAKFGKPWEVAAPKSPMAAAGFTGRQDVVTEKNGSTPIWWGRLMSTMLNSTDNGLYGGPGTEQKTAEQLAMLYETRLYGFRHQTRQVASQSLTVSGHQGWLVGYYLTYHRPKVKATGEIFTVAVVDTGRARPGVLFMSIPDTQKKLWPDFNYVLHTLKVV